MSIAKGVQSGAILYEESTYGQPPGTPKGTRITYQSYNLQVSQALIQPATIVADRQRSRPSADVVDLAGSIVMEPSALDIGIMLKHLMGTVATSGTDPYEHVFTPSDLPVGLHFELDNGPVLAGPSRYQVSKGVRIDSLAIAAPVNGYPTWTFNCVGQDEAYAAAPLDASPLEPGHESMPMAIATLTENSVVLGVGSNLTINIANNIETDVRAISPGGLRVDAPESFVDVSGTLEVLFNDTSLLDKATNGTPSDLLIEWKLGDGLGSAGNEYISAHVGKLIFERTSSPVPDATTRRITLNFQGYKDGATDSIKFTIRNALADVVKP